MEQERLTRTTVTRDDTAMTLTLRELTAGLQVVAISAHNVAPDRYAYLLHGIFPDLAALQRAALAILDPETPVGDTLDLVCLDEAAYREWLDLVTRTIAALPRETAAQGAGRPPIERGRVLPSGELELFVEWEGLPSGRLALRIPQGRWRWRYGQPA